MNDKELKEHYRNLYQIVKQDKDLIEKELEEFKLLSTVKSDIIDSLNKRIKSLEHSIEILQNQSNIKYLHTDREKSVRIIKIR